MIHFFWIKLKEMNINTLSKKFSCYSSEYKEFNGSEIFSGDASLVFNIEVV